MTVKAIYILYDDERILSVIVVSVIFIYGVNVFFFMHS